MVRGPDTCTSTSTEPMHMDCLVSMYVYFKMDTATLALDRISLYDRGCSVHIIIVVKYIIEA